ncbi:MAG: hypothetical protein NE328_09180 [Lentisphaeraceae bacterium]|nr:hypothetical protein [Lentisphaeraceae bacterium]
MNKILLISIIVFSSSLLSLQSEEKYKILFHRENTLEQFYHKFSKTVIREEIKSQVDKKEEINTKYFKVEIHGTVSAGGSTGISYSLNVDKFLIQQSPDIDPLKLYPKGTVITAEKVDGKSVFKINGKDLAAKSLFKDLHIFFKNCKGSSSDNDKMFISDERYKIGDTLKIDSKYAVEKLKAQKILIDAKNTNGGLKLEKLINNNNVECILVEGLFHAKDAKVNPLSLPPGSNINDAYFLLKVDAHLPTDLKIPLLDFTFSIKNYIDLNIKTPNGDMGIKRTSQQIIRSQIN